MVSPLSKNYNRFVGPYNRGRASVSPRKEPAQTNVLQKFHFSDGIYCGQIHGKVRKGLAAFMTYRGHLILGHFENNLLNGRAVLFLPSSGVVYCHYVNNEMNGPAVLKYPDGDLLCCRLRAGLLEGEAFRYEAKKKRWQRLYYSKGICDRSHVKFDIYESMEEWKLPPQLRRTEHGKMCIELMEGNYFFTPGEQSKAVRLGMIKTERRTYYGFLDNNKEAGLGHLISKQNSYVGYFTGKKLSGLARILFEDKNLYFGYFSNGEGTKHGFLYSPSTDLTSIYNCEGGQEVVIEQVEGYSTAKLAEVIDYNLPRAKERQAFAPQLVQWFEEECLYHYLRAGKNEKDLELSQRSKKPAKKEDQETIDKMIKSLHFEQFVEPLLEQVHTFRQRDDQPQPSSVSKPENQGFLRVPETPPPAYNYRTNESENDARLPSPNQSGVKPVLGTRQNTPFLDTFKREQLLRTQDKESTKKVRTSDHKPLFAESRKQFMRQELLKSEVITFEEEDQSAKSKHTMESTLLLRLRRVIDSHKHI